MKNIKNSMIVATNRDVDALKPLFVTTSNETELIIIDSDYNEKTKGFLQNQGGFLQIVYAPVKSPIPNSKRDFSQALNTALLYSEGEYIIRCDDSLELSPNFWEIVEEDINHFNFSDNKFVVIGEKLWESKKHTKWIPYDDFTNRYTKIVNPFFTFSFGIFPIRDLNILNGYSEIYDLLGWGFEDVQFLHRLMVMGYEVEFDNDLLAYSYNHPLGHSLSDFTDVYYNKFDRIEIGFGKVHAYNNFEYADAKEEYINNLKSKHTLKC